MPTQLTGNLTAIFCMIIWATNFPVADILLRNWHPVLLTPVRSGFAALALVCLLFAIGRGRQLFALKVSDLAGAGGVALSASTLLFVWGQRYVDPVTAAILVSAMPVWSVIIGLATRTERLTPMLCAGIMLAVVGGVMASLGLQDGADGTRDGSIVGALMIAAGTILYVWYSRTMVAVSPEVSSLAKAAICMVVLTLMTTIAAELALLFDVVPMQYDLSWTSLGLLFWLGAVAIGSSTVLWFAAGRMLGVTITSMHHNLVPLYVMMMALLLGGTINMLTLIGAGFVIAGAALAQLPHERFSLKRRRA